MSEAGNPVAGEALCTECGSSQFHLSDGRTFCLECGTQSQVSLGGGGSTLVLPDFTSCICTPRMSFMDFSMSSCALCLTNV